MVDYQTQNFITNGSRHAWCIHTILPHICPPPGRFEYRTRSCPNRNQHQKTPGNKPSLVPNDNFRSGKRQSITKVSKTLYHCMWRTNRRWVKSSLPLTRCEQVKSIKGIGFSRRGGAGQGEHGLNHAQCIGVFRSRVRHAKQTGGRNYRAKWGSRNFWRGHASNFIQVSKQ